MTGQRRREAAGGRIPNKLYLAISYGILLHALTGFKQPWRTKVPQIGSDGALSDEAVAAQDAWRPMADLVEPHGYTLTEHFVTTADGYQLRMFNIPCGPRSSSSHRHSRNSQQSSNSRNSSSSSFRPISSCSSGRPPVLLQHALMDSSAGWLLLGPQRSLALQLVDAGFSVWLANTRGNRFSRNHTMLNPDMGPEFWRFSFDDMAAHDLPVMVDHVLARSEHEQLVYLGYSQGTMIALAALSSQPQLASKISLAMLLAPVAIVRHMRSWPFVLGSLAHVDTLGMHLKFGEWGGHRPRSGNMMKKVCARSDWACTFLLRLLCGSNPTGNLDHSVMPLLYDHLPSGTSLFNMAHWAQAIRRGSTTAMHKFDYGSDCSAGGAGPRTPGSPRRCNLEVYGQAEPPAYNFTQITTPLALFTGDYDALSVTADVELLKAQLRPGLVALHHHEPHYAHLDYELGLDAPTKVYPHILQLAQQYSARYSRRQ